MVTKNELDIHLKGIKALSAKVDSIQVKFGWYLALFTILIFLAQKFFN